MAVFIVYELEPYLTLHPQKFPIYEKKMGENHGLTIFKDNCEVLDHA
jgi:hypothetical protein